MGVFDRSDKPSQQLQPHEDDGQGVAGAATAFVERLLSVGIDGKGAFSSAEAVADEALRRRGTVPQAIDAVVWEHTRLAAAGGFVTGLGGFVTLPVALPANVAGFYIVATRMAAAIAHLRGYDLQEGSVRSAVLLSLVGADAQDVLAKVGYVGTSRLASLATQQLPGPLMMAVNKAVGFRLLTQVGKKTFARLGRGVPVMGGLLGAGMDGVLVRQIAAQVRTEFPQR
ncbi:hypothetical protein KEM60_02383 [Austwickia sp. TVS 96-490-7B]|uniref:EcsC family protein n=1 Tax=Austwickia sp. TVS 96-490-7B TaxID=2830843 RepID=UPI001C5743C9|nr:EcsC family protein [Austwickia sp. TVS 96-490-7B]MBW3086172.1 hypothetical protein [Austwickia sp. TVS 96-490-7B]